MFFSKLGAPPEVIESPEVQSGGNLSNFRGLQKHASWRPKEKKPLVAIKPFGNRICGGRCSFVSGLLASQNELAGSLGWILLPGLHGVWHQTPI